MLKYLISLGENSKLTFKTLSRKAAMLVALLAFSRQSKISYFSVDGISRTDRSIAFFFDKPIKNSKRIPKPLVFHKFNDQPLLCPVSTLDHFIMRSAVLRSSNSLFVKLNPMIRFALPLLVPGSNNYWANKINGRIWINFKATPQGPRPPPCIS